MLPVRSLHHHIIYREVFMSLTRIIELQMGGRNCTISVSEEERDALNSVAETAFGTTDVPYGAVISMLTTDYLDD